jgi:hypothetical protein
VTPCSGDLILDLEQTCEICWQRGIDVTARLYRRPKIPRGYIRLDKGPGPTTQEGMAPAQSHEGWSHWTRFSTSLTPLRLLNNICAPIGQAADTSLAWAHAAFSAASTNGEPCRRKPRNDDL